MYLVKIQSLELEEFIGEHIPPYAILSHRWGSEELNFKEVFKKRTDQQKEGYRKLIGACRAAAEYNVRYLWIDTCCIDKKSSAELSEAINSMFSWYQNAKICLAYLQDVDPNTDLEKAFADSIWFTRAWTLQELLAPKDVAFFDRDWTSIGTKESRGNAIELITGIPSDALAAENSLRDWSLCERMRWASERQATRPEDVAYSLMGIFDVQMPLLYGEGTKAFTRLQEEIIRHSMDPTFLLWGLHKTAFELLASTPAEFRPGQGLNIRSYSSNTLLSLTNIGLNINARVIRYRLGIYALVIGETDEANILLLVRRSPSWWKLDAYYRIGVVILPNTDIEYSRDQKMTLLRATEEQNLAGRIELDQSFIKIMNGFSVTSDPNFLLGPASCNKQAPDPYETGGRWSSARTPHSLNCSFMGFGSAATHMKCTAYHDYVIWFKLSFDFESRPCVLISDQPNRIHLYKDIRNPSVWHLSDAFEGSMRDLHGFWDSATEVELWQITDEQSRSISYFLRSSDEYEGFVSAKLPVRLTSPEHPVWLTIVAPWTPRNHLRDRWSLTITSIRPTVAGLGVTQF